MRAELRPHYDFPCPAVRTIVADVKRSAGRLILRYRLCGDTEALAIPPPAQPGRADGLWRHSCFEAFVMPAAEEAYVELNFSPSGEWAAYRFDSYRSGMADLAGAAPRIAFARGGDALELEAEIELDLPTTGRLALSAVVEAADGSLSYWALRHPPGRPDFHHRDCFAIELPPAD